ncbi:MFS family permease [Nocardiopsis mwathae]|uniref:MFS family permease n=1 Tax=Nocardiopsis mwathae TaxID=1472723 RepID=A0A7W9YLH5_9ACTN|nr:MFS transporter [Nocardiopsis mwathae]MBB6174373.1 MFS family permease [Nocardiopsis mwathae]
MSARAGPRGVLALLVVFMIINFADKAVLGLTADAIMAELHLSATQFGTIAGSFYLLFSVSALLIGFVGDRVRAKPLLAGLVLIWSVAQLPILIPTAGFGFLLVTRILLGAGEGPAFPLANHTAFTHFPSHRRSLPAAMVTIGGALGAVVGGPLTILISEVFGWRAAFGALGAIGLVWLVAWLRYGGSGPYAAGGSTSAGAAAPSVPMRSEPEKVDGRTGDVSDQERSRPTADTAVQHEDGHEPMPDHVPFLRIVATRTWLGATFATATVLWSLALALAWIPIYLEDEVGLNKAGLSVAIGLPSLCAILLVLSGGGLAQRLIGRGVSYRVAQGCVGGTAVTIGGVFMLAMTRVEAVPLVLLCFAVAFAIGNTQTPLSNAAMSHICPERKRSAVLGASYAAATVSSVLAPYITGRIIDAAPSQMAGFSLSFDLAGLLLLVGGLAAFLLIRPDSDAAALRRSVGAPERPAGPAHRT